MIRLRIDKGLDLALGQTPTEASEVMPARVAVLGADYPGIRPNLAVTKGDRVAAGAVLLTDRARPEVRLTAPAAGRIRAIHRGPRRSVEAVEIEVDDPTEARPLLEQAPSSSPDAETIRRLLLETGLWTALRARPFDRIPAPGDRVESLYVTAMDSNALAPDAVAGIRARADEFSEGLARLASLVDACYVCMAPGAGLPCPEGPGIVPVEVAGPHPAGLPGTHIYAIARAQRHRREPRGPLPVVWHIGYQDVIAIGGLFLDGRLDRSKTVSVAGPGIQTPRLVRTLCGADLTALTGALEPGVRVISGPVLAGRPASRTTAFLGRYHNQVVVLPPAAGSAREGGTGSGMLALEAFEGVWPFEVPPLPLLRALLIEDTETVAALGCTHLAAEDLALCAYLCPERLDYGAALERTLEEIRRGR
jgi:Na+-transporting NADH:ubiquinone oxidoreductase subunit A